MGTIREVIENIKDEEEHKTVDMKDIESILDTERLIASKPGVKLTWQPIQRAFYLYEGEAVIATTINRRLAITMYNTL